MSAPGAFLAVILGSRGRECPRQVFLAARADAVVTCVDNHVVDTVTLGRHLVFRVLLKDSRLFLFPAMVGEPESS